MSQTVAKPFRRNKALATGMLVAMGAMFLATFLVPEPSTWVLFLRAVAEAGMIGGLADWFAVEALFRHPLRIPIPHTALLPKSKNRVATNIGDFITEHFLTPDLIRQTLMDLNAAAALSGWLLSPGNAGLISQKTSLVLKSSLLETGASEQAARMTAMDNATRNAGDMIKKLTLQYNNVRQANITKELLEITSGSEAL